MHVCECAHGWEEEVSVAHNNAGTSAREGGGEVGKWGLTARVHSGPSLLWVFFAPPLLFLHWCYPDNVRLDLPLAAQLSNQVTSS